MVTLPPIAYDDKTPHNDDDKSSNVVNDIQDIENYNDGMINNQIPQQQKQRQLRRFERRHMVHFSLAFAFVVASMIAFVQQNYSSLQYKSNKLKSIEKIGKDKVLKRIMSQKKNKKINQESKDHTESKHNKVWPFLDNLEETTTEHSKDGYFEYADNEEPDPELLHNSEDEYHVKEYLAGRIKRRVLKSPPLSSMTHRRRNATTAERVWSFNISQRNLHLHDDKPNVYCARDRTHGAENDGDGSCSWFMVNEYVDTSHLPPSQIIAWKARVTRHPAIFPTSPDNAIVHHMNIVPCSKEIDKSNPPLTWDEPWGFMEGDGPCDQIFFAYDRGSFVGYEMPDDVGIRIGKGTPHERLLIQWHYLLPPCYDDRNETMDIGGGFRSCPSPYTGGIRFEEAEDGVVVDESGFEILVTPDLRPFDSATLGVIDPYMLVDYGADNFLYSFESNVKLINEILAHDLETYGALTPFANHLHQHDHGTQMWTSHLRNGEKIGEYGRFVDYGGGVNSTVERLGVGETFMDILPGRDGAATPHLDDRFVVLNANNDREMMTSHAFVKGDTIRTNCVMDSKHKNIWHAKTNKPIDYGLFTGEEMCGTLLMYYPHDATKRFTPGAIMADERDASTRRTCFDWKSSSLSSLSSSGMAQGGTCEMPHGNHDDYDWEVKRRNQYFKHVRVKYSGGTPHLSPGQICDGVGVDVDGRRVLLDEAEGSATTTVTCDP